MQAGHWIIPSFLILINFSPSTESIAIIDGCHSVCVFFLFWFLVSVFQSFIFFKRHFWFTPRCAQEDSNLRLSLYQNDGLTNCPMCALCMGGIANTKSLRLPIIYVCGSPAHVAHAFWMQFFLKDAWTRRDLNPKPSACKADVLPLFTTSPLDLLGFEPKAFRKPDGCSTIRATSPILLYIPYSDSFFSDLYIVVRALLILCRNFCSLLS